MVKRKTRRAQRRLVRVGLLSLALALACSGVNTASEPQAPAPSPSAGSGYALPQMVPATEIGGVLLAPVGWTASTSTESLPSGDQVIGYALEELPGSPSGASVMVMVFPLFQGPDTPALFADATREMLTGRTLVDSQTAADGSVTEVWQGTVDGLRATLALRYGADTAAGQGMTVAFAAPPERYQSLGGLWMLDAIFPAQAPSGSSQPVTTPAPAATGGLEWHRCRCYEKQFGLRAGYTVCAADPVGAAFWETIAISCLPDGCRNCVCAPSGESCSQDGQML